MQCGIIDGELLISLAINKYVLSKVEFVEFAEFAVSDNESLIVIVC